MRRMLAPVLALCSLVTNVSASRAQSGPDNDSDGAPGYVHSVFDHGPIDSINLYNGQLTIPIAIGPSYPVGPKLRVQFALNYNSRVDEFGSPASQLQSPDFFYKPLVGNPSLPIGWELTLGAIKQCKHGATWSNCYFGPDGSQHAFNAERGNGWVTSDGSPLFLTGTGPFDMWDGDGNHYSFDQQVSGAGVTGTHDFQLARDGWYLTSVADPFGNSYSVSYYTGLSPCWTYGASTCETVIASRMKMLCTTPPPAGGWVPKDVTLPSGSRIHVNLGTVNGVADMITSVDFPVFVDGAAATRSWTLRYAPTAESYGKFCGSANGNALWLYANLQELASLDLPADDSGAAPKYQFTYVKGFLAKVTLPTQGSIAYCWANWNFHHGRSGALRNGCPSLAPPSIASILVPYTGQFCGGADPEELAPDIAPGDCVEDNELRWTDVQTGVIQRTETVGASVNVTDYKQYALPRGESGSGEPQTLTIVVQPATDRNAAADAGRRRAKVLLFTSSPRLLGPFPAQAKYSAPGDRVGADVEERVFETEPSQADLSEPLCPGDATDKPFCASKALRVLQKTFEYDNPTDKVGNRRLQSEKTIHGAGNCASCPYHLTTFSAVNDTWENNGRHYDTETHGGTLGGDARTIVTDWNPVNWITGPPAGGLVLPNVYERRTVTEGSSVRDEYFEFDRSDGFLKGRFVYDAARDLAFLACRYDDGHGSVDKEFTKTFASPSTPSRTYCSANYATFPGSVGQDGDLFGKTYTHQNGELLTERFVNGAVGTPTFALHGYTRDATTGWIKTAADPAGRTTAYTYDSLGRVRQITPPSSAELKTWVCYEGPNATSAYRATTRQSCPVAPTNAAAATWQRYEYDGLGRGIREKRLQPGASVVKKFTLFDGTGNARFASEWVPDATSETVTADLATTCAFSGGPLATSRPSAAPGTYRLCFDPFGRPQQIVGAKHSSLHTVDRTDGAEPYSDTSEAVKTYCVNAQFANLGQATCASGGLNPVSTAEHDAFGRLTKLTEPTGESTTYGYDVNGKLTSVTQGAQGRTFGYDANGFLRSETTPEGGAVSYDGIGSLGNVLKETRPGGLVVARKFDFAGRSVEEDAGGSKHVVNCYDGAGACVDGSPGSAGGAYPGGKLTRRYGYNWIPTAGPVVDEQFEYSDAGGRLSKLTAAVGNGDLAASASQTFSYGNLGLVSSHGHPRSTGSFTVADTYTNGLPTAISANGVGVVTAAAWNPAAGLASWTAGNSGAPMVTIIAQDATMLPRPASISNSLWSSGAYGYDGGGNVLKIGASDAFTYDSRSRLSSAKYGSTPRTFAYDRYGNLTQNGGSIAIDPATNRVTSWGASYDSRGNLTAYNGDTMAWDGLDRQYRNTNASSDWVFLFNGAGERIAKFPGASSVLRREMARLITEANKAAGKSGWSSAPNPCTGSAFTNPPCSDPDANYIQSLYIHGVAAGCNGSDFCPDAPVTRAQMAAFVVKGYKPEPYAAPACRGIFTDVTCSGPYAAFAPYIETLYSEGITSGCSTSPLQFCPGSNVTSWQILVWMAKTPAVPGGVAWAAAYHPVPRGSIYTFRDEQNRIVTEMAGGTGGSATATLSVTRDNVFLGNTLVASYVASPAGWQYTTSDHLGSPRVVFNQSGQLLETHKYWPYGEETSGVPPAQSLSFCLMEKDAGATRYYDHARTHDHGMGRFLSPDRVGGSPGNPQTWNRYAYTLGNPMKHIDPDGLLTVLVHGTDARGSADFRQGGRFYEHVVSTVPDRAYASFQWSGADNHHARVKAANDLAGFIKAYNFSPGEKLNIIGHSHGGNVAILAVNVGLGRTVSNLVTLGAPSRPGYHLQDPSAVANFVNVLNSFDGVQIRGGGNYESPAEFGPAARTQPNALNINWNVDSGPVGSHGGLHSPGAWDFTLPHLQLDATQRADRRQDVVWDHY